MSFVSKIHWRFSNVALNIIDCFHLRYFPPPTDWLRLQNLVFLDTLTLKKNYFWQAVKFIFVGSSAVMKFYKGMPF